MNDALVSSMRPSISSDRTNMCGRGLCQVWLSISTFCSLKRHNYNFKLENIGSPPNLLINPFIRKLTSNVYETKSNFAFSQELDGSIGSKTATDGELGRHKSISRGLNLGPNGRVGEYPNWSHPGPLLYIDRVENTTYDGTGPTCRCTKRAI